MKNKVLVKLMVPELEITYDVFVPVNEVIWKVKELLLKVVCDLTNITFDSSIDLILLNKNNCKIYNNNDIIINTDIRNGTELLLVSVKNEF